LNAGDVLIMGGKGLRATQDVIRIWRKFDNFPMETLTKAWYSNVDSGCKQRTVEIMKMHREQYGTSGNCFDLAIWLIDEFRKENLDCYAILTAHSHVAVVVINGEGKKYLCDLGDQWIEPILIDRNHEDYTEEFLNGFFPGAQVKLTSRLGSLVVTYRRPNGKVSSQEFSLNPISDEELIHAGQITQQNLSAPLVEKRIFTEKEVLHWEFDNYNSFISSNEGKMIESRLNSIEEWAERISKVSGISREVVEKALEVYSKRSSHN